MTPKKSCGFTLVELLTVMAVIAILAGLILSISGFAQRKAAMSRAEAEIAGISTACENYRADNGIYPRAPSTASAKVPANATDTLDARTSGNPTVAAYQAASLFLYTQLSGDLNADGKVNAADAALNNNNNNVTPKGYMEFKPGMLYGTKDTSGNLTAVTYFQDPFGYSYGYSTAYQADIDAGTNPPTHGYNPTFDVWTTTGKTTIPTPGATGDVTLQWIKNW